MFDALRILTLLLMVLAMTPALAHALELPGKLRLSKDAYIAMQPIYYPGFTIAGICEPLAIISTAILLFATPWGTADFWLTLAALLGLTGMHAAYWILTHPVNKFWLEDEELSRFGAGFFSFASAGASGPNPPGGLDRPARPLGVFARRAGGIVGGEPRRPRRRGRLTDPTVRRSDDLGSAGR